MKLRVLTCVQEEKNKILCLLCALSAVWAKSRFREALKFVVKSSEVKYEVKLRKK